MLTASIDTSGVARAFDAARAFHEARVQRALLAATARGAGRLERRLREDMSAAGLAGLGRAIKATSDQAAGRGVHRLADGFSAWGLVGVRSRSERTRGAIEAYTQGAEIRPTRGRWLWVPTKDIRRIVGKGSERRRLTPGNWASSGMDQRVGELVQVKSVDGRPLLVVKNVGVSAAGKRGSARSLTKTGRLRKGQVGRELIIAFVAIPNTSRRARIDVDAIHAQVMSELPELFAAAMRRA